MADGAARELVAPLRAAVDQLLDAALTPLSSAELTALLAALEVERRRLESVDHEVVAEVTARGIAGDYGRGSTRDLLVDLLRVAPAEAKARANQAYDLGPRCALDGQPLEPILPRVAAAQREGAIAAAHAAVIIGGVEKIPAHLAHEVTAVVEQYLVEQARHTDPRSLAGTAVMVLARLDLDGDEPRERELARRRAFDLHRLGDGSFRVSGQVTPEWAAIWQPIIDALAAPQPSEDGVGDDRTATQRRHDGMQEAGERLLRSGALPDCGGAPVTVLVRLNEDQLRERTGTAETAHGDPIPVERVLELAAEADMVPVVLDARGGVRAYGRTRRTASPGQRRALALRDGGCCFPGCTRPSSWTQAHHVLPWIDGGMTDIENLCLLCGFHHREFRRRGWEVRMELGRPEWLPPAWLDETRRPVRNTACHLPEFDFAA